MKHVPFYLKNILFYFIPAFILMFLTISVNAQVCTNPNGVIYGLSNSGNIVPITVSNSAVGATINPAYTSSTSSANGIGYNAQNGNFYYFQNGNSGASQQFVSFNPATNTYATLAPSPSTAIVYRGCVNFNGTGYYCLDQNSNLCYYNITTNTWTLIGSVFADQYGNNVTSTFKAQASGDIAIDGLGNLWIVSSGSSAYGVYKISAPLPTVATATISITQLVPPTTPTPTSTNFAGIAFNATGEIYVCTTNDLYILNNDLSLSHLGTFSVAGVGGDLTSCNFPITVLPVSWQSVNVDLQSNNSVLINWIVNQQINSKEYTVERSTDGKTWSDVGTVESTGNTTTAQSYSYTDANPAAGNNYYRIRQTDFDGKTNFSIVKTVNVAAATQLAIWPNPSKNIINIQKENNGTNSINAEIFNQSGQKVSSSLLKSGINTVDISSLPAGYYIVHIDLANGEKFNQKLVKL